MTLSVFILLRGAEAAIQSTLTNWSPGAAETERSTFPRGTLGEFYRSSWGPSTGVILCSMQRAAAAQVPGSQGESVTSACLMWKMSVMDGDDGTCAPVCCGNALTLGPQTDINEAN